jgi:small subunit ribosomal protein S13
MESLDGIVDAVDLPKDKRIEIALTYIYGIGRPSANKILEKANVNKDTRVNKLTELEVVRIRDIIEQEHKVEGDLRREVATNIKRLMDIGSYRGLRHRKSLPVHGQRTHTNARTRKGPRRAIIGKKKEKE